MIQAWDQSLEGEMLIVAVTTALCAAGVAFCVRFLVALCKEPSRGRVGYWVRVRLSTGEGVIAQILTLKLLSCGLDS
jgi:hypothetical protein